jgi:hypothetical protein
VAARQVQAASDNSRVRLALPVLLAAACAAIAAALPASAGAAKATQKLVIYSTITRAEFLNNADDRRRSIINNPFTTNTAKLMKVMQGNEKQNGPLPGDAILYSYNLYSDAAVKKQNGTAVFTCAYSFNKEGICQGYFELNGGTLLASGPVVFSTFEHGAFQLPVRGGTDTYLGARGGLTIGAANKTTSARKLSFDLLAG